MTKPIESRLEKLEQRQRPNSDSFGNRPALRDRLRRERIQNEQADFMKTFGHVFSKAAKAGRREELINVVIEARKMLLEINEHKEDPEAVKRFRELHGD